MRNTRAADQTILLTAILLFSCVGVTIWFMQLFHLVSRVPSDDGYISIAVPWEHVHRGKRSATWNGQWRQLLDRGPEVTRGHTGTMKNDVRDEILLKRKINYKKMNIWVKSSKIYLSGKENKSKTLEIDCTNRKLATFSEDLLCKKRKTFLTNFKNPCWYEGEEQSLSCLPYFHIIGVCKSGTTDLYHRVTQHPGVLENKGMLGKETWFWSWQRYGNGRMPGGTMYLSQFAKLFDAETISQAKSLRSDGSTYHHLITGHGEPMDFWDQSNWRLIPQNDPEEAEPNVTTPYLIKYVNPNIKLILLLRNPVERLYSHYLHGNYGNTTGQFHRDVLQTIRFLNECQSQRTLRSCLYDKNNEKKFKVPISASLYHVHLQEWLAVFPRQQLLVLRSEAYRDSIATTLQHVFRFLDIEPLGRLELSRIAGLPLQHKTAKKVAIGSMRNDTRELLTEYFRTTVHKVAEILQDEQYLKWL